MPGDLPKQVFITEQGGYQPFFNTACNVFQLPDTGVPDTDFYNISTGVSAQPGADVQVAFDCTLFNRSSAIIPMGATNCTLTFQLQGKNIIALPVFCPGAGAYNQANINRLPPSPCSIAAIYPAPNAYGVGQVPQTINGFPTDKGRPVLFSYPIPTVNQEGQPVIPGIANQWANGLPINFNFDWVNVLFRVYCGTGVGGFLCAGLTAFSI